MPEPIQTPETQALIDSLVREPCLTCGGKTIIEGSCDCAEEGTFAKHMIACPSCQEDDLPTGLRFWQLSKMCSNCLGYTVIPIFLASGEREKVQCPHCNGAGRIPKQGADLLVAVEEELKSAGQWEYVYCPEAGPMSHTYQVWKLWTFTEGGRFKDADRLSAALQALDALRQKEQR